ncbi:uncharacterized protein LOC116574988 [Mustela erminea]|uniref:uncharacterized protein LOC116574988 n=1 Tax=Mustela erminea TaxID=36723 RepID=UPI001386E6A3|nr:uncharacterized protein LOC116574988 [Mustela erminea]
MDQSRLRPNTDGCLGETAQGRSMHRADAGWLLSGPLSALWDGRRTPQVETLGRLLRPEPVGPTPPPPSRVRPLQVFCPLEPPSLAFTDIPDVHLTWLVQAVVSVWALVRREGPALPVCSWRFLGVPECGHRNLPFRPLWWPARLFPKKQPLAHCWGRFQDDELVFSASDDCRRVSPSISDSAIWAYLVYFRVSQVRSLEVGVLEDRPHGLGSGSEWDQLGGLSRSLHLLGLQFLWQENGATAWQTPRRCKQGRQAA